MEKDTYELYDRKGNLIKEKSFDRGLPVRKREKRLVDEWLYNDMDNPEVEKAVICIGDGKEKRCRAMYPKIDKRIYTAGFNKDEEGERWDINHLWKLGESDDTLSFKKEQKRGYIIDKIKQMLLNEDFGKTHISSKGACNIDPQKIKTNIEQSEYNEIGRLSVDGIDDLCQYEFVYDHLPNDKIEPHSISLDCFYGDLETIEEKCL